jgi:periplasmic protein TonB
MSGTIPDFSSSQSDGYKQILPGFLVALFIHIGLFVLFIPVIEYSPPAPPMRIAVQVTQLREEVEPEPAPQPVVSKPKAPVITKEVLTAKNDIPPEPEDMFVLEQPPEVEEIKPEILTEPSKPEPIPEPIKVEPKKPEPIKIEKVKPKPKPKPEKPKPEKPKKVIKPQETKPVVKPKVAEVVEPVTESSVEVVDGANDVSPVESSNKPSGSSSSSTSISNNASANGEAENSRGSANEVTKNEAWRGYGQLLYALVSKNKTYPQLAIRRHLEGRTMVSVRFDKGRMVEITVLGKGSGHTVLDKAAREMVEKAIKSLPVRGDLAKKSFSVVVPVDFRLTN